MAVPRILIVRAGDEGGSEEMSTGPAGLRALLESAKERWEFHFATATEAHHLLAEPNANAAIRDFAAAIVLRPHVPTTTYESNLRRLFDELFTRHIGTIWLSNTPADLAAGERLAKSEGLMAVPDTCSSAELFGRISGLLAVRPTIVQLQRENVLLNRFQSGLHDQMAVLDEEMRLAARIQADFLPRPLPTINGCRFDVLFRPASYVSGDIYEATRLDESHIGFYVADAVGHGMPAALLTIFIKRTLKTKEIGEHSYRIVPPHEALDHLNQEMIAQELSQSQFATMVYGVLDTRTFELQYARAGHPLPLWFKADGQCQELESDGGLLGVFAQETYALETVQLSPGECVLFYSDGFESAFSDPAGISNERYRQEFAKLRHADPRAFFTAMEGLLDQQEGSLNPRDDLTALCLTVG